MGAAKGRLLRAVPLGTVGVSGVFSSQHGVEICCRGATCSAITFYLDYPKLAARALDGGNTDIAFSSALSLTNRRRRENT